MSQTKGTVTVNHHLNKQQLREQLEMCLSENSGAYQRVLDYIVDLETRLGEVEVERDAMMVPPQIEDWKELVALAYKPDSDGARRIFNITSEYNRMRAQRDSLLNALSAERAEQILGVYAKLFLDCTNDTLRAYRDAARKVGM